MKSLCTKGSDAEAKLEWLTGLVASKILTGPKAWSLFSQPKKASIKVDEVTYDLKAHHESMKGLKDAVVTHLYKKYGGACAYCRRPVAHYGYGWQIEHVLSKAWHPEKAFDLANLTIGCIECNSWKSSAVDAKVKGGLTLPIVNPVEIGFKYSDHLRFVSVVTESLALAKYAHSSTQGRETYKRLRFHEIERSILVDSVDATSSSLHARMDLLIARAIQVPEAQELVDLLATLKSSIYAKDRKPPTR